MKKFWNNLGMFVAGMVFAVSMVMAWHYLKYDFDKCLILACEEPETVFVPAEAEPETQYCVRFTVNTEEKFWFDGDMQCPCDHDFSVASDLGNHWCIYGASDLEVTAQGESRVASQRGAEAEIYTDVPLPRSSSRLSFQVLKALRERAIRQWNIGKQKRKR